MPTVTELADSCMSDHVTAKRKGRTAEFYRDKYSGPMFEASVAIRCVVFPAADLHSGWALCTVVDFGHTRCIKWNITNMTTGRCTISGSATGQNAVTSTGQADKRSRAASHRRSLLSKPLPHPQPSDKASPPESTTGSDRTRVMWTLAGSIEKHADE
jgi:hypothetical protein